MDKETALEMIDVLKEMNQNILRCMNEICENAKKIEVVETKVDKLINGRKYPNSKPIEYTEEWL